MKTEDMKRCHLTPIEDFIEEDYGKIGTASREKFEMDCDAFILGEELKVERQKAGLTQQQLAPLRVNTN